MDEWAKHPQGEPCYALRCINCSYTRYPYTPKIFEATQTSGGVKIPKPTRITPIPIPNTKRHVEGVVFTPYYGSEKQLKWATDIKRRFQVLADQTDNTQLPDIPYAVFWINNRTATLDQLREAAKKEGKLK
jgi:hypothetical protein